MAGSLKRWFYAMLLATIVCRPAVTQATGTNPIETPILVFRIVNLANVPERTVERAVTYAESVYRRSGIATEWLFDNSEISAQSATRRLELTVILVSSDAEATLALDDWNLGFATGSNGRGARRAWVFPGHIEEEARKVHHERGIELSKVEGLILGHVIAHEAGHLLLPDGAHSDRGVMLPRLNVPNIDQALRGQLIFTPSQGELIRMALRRETEKQ